MDWDPYTRNSVVCFKKIKKKKYMLTYFRKSGRKQTVTPTRSPHPVRFDSHPSLTVYTHFTQASAALGTLSPMHSAPSALLISLEDTILRAPLAPNWSEFRIH